MTSMIEGIVEKGNWRSPTELSDTQKTLLAEAGLKEGTKEYKDAALQLKIRNLSGAVTKANEVMQAMEEMGKKSSEGLSR